MFNNLLTAFGNGMSGAATTLVNVFTKIAEIFYNKTDGITFFGFLGVILLGVSLLVVGFEFLYSFLFKGGKEDDD